MRKMRGMGIYMKKRITKSLVFVLAMAALSGCGKGDSEKEKTTEQVTTEATTVAEETTEATTESVTEEATQSDGDVDYEALYAEGVDVTALGYGHWFVNNPSGQMIDSYNDGTKEVINLTETFEKPTLSLTAEEEEVYRLTRQCLQR